MKRDQGVGKLAELRRGLFMIVCYHERRRMHLGTCIFPQRMLTSVVHVIAHSTLWLDRNRIATVP